VRTGVSNFDGDRSSRRSGWEARRQSGG
jgi:hypothetical protein